MKTKYFLLSIIFFLFSANILTAQVQDSTKIIIKEVIIKKDSVTNSLKKNKWALQFEVGYNFQIKSFEDLMFSLKYHLSNKSAIRFGAGFGLQYRNIELLDKGINNNDPFDKVKKRDISVVLQYLYYPSPNADINLVFGIGPKYKHYYSFSQENMYDDFKEINDNVENSFGLSAIFGVEWFVTKSISFFAIYNASLMYSIGHSYMYFKDNTIYYSGVGKDYKEFNFQGNTAKLGLSAYFDFPF